MMTYEEHRGPIAGKKVVWSGDGNNVCASYLHAAGRFGFDLTFTGPVQLDPEMEFVGWRAGGRMSRSSATPSRRSRGGSRGHGHLGEHA